MNMEAIVKRAQGFGVTLQPYVTAETPAADLQQGNGISTNSAIMAVVIVIPKGSDDLSITFDVVGRTKGSDQFVVLNNFRDLEADGRGWKETIMIPTEEELAVVVTSKGSGVTSIDVKIGPCLGD